MATITGPITLDGALVTLAIGVSEVRRQRLQRFNFPVPAASHICALIDPGSSVTVADEQALRHLGIAPLIHLPLASSASGLAANTLPVFQLSVTLHDAAGNALMYWPQVDVFGTSYHTTDVVHGVFGRDLLASCVFHYDGKGGVFSLTA